MSAGDAEVQDKLLARLRTVVHQHTHKDVSGLDLDEDLAESLGLDSLAGLRLLAYVEKAFDHRFPDERLSGFRTLRHLLDELSGRKGGSP